MKKGQALLELAIFVGLMLTVLLAALNYRRNLYEQRMADIKVFEDTKKQAEDYTFTEKDVDDEVLTYSGATANYSLNIDRQANRIFQGGQRRTVGSSSSVYWSPSESPPDLNYNYYNNQDLNMPPVKKIYWDRASDEDPEDGMKFSTAKVIALMSPVIAKAVGHYFKLEKHDWYKRWLNKWLRRGVYMWLAAEMAIAIAKMEDSETKRHNLEADDKKYGELGWRVCDESHKIKDGCTPGSQYVRDVYAYIYGTGNTIDTKSADYHETQHNDSGNRSITARHVAQHMIYRRYDISDPNHQTLPLAQHTFDDLGPRAVSINLGGAQSESW